MTEEIDWDNLPTATSVWVETIKKLPDGLCDPDSCEYANTTILKIEH